VGQALAKRHQRREPLGRGATLGGEPIPAGLLVDRADHAATLGQELGNGAVTFLRTVSSASALDTERARWAI